MTLCQGSSSGVLSPGLLTSSKGLRLLMGFHAQSTASPSHAARLDTLGAAQLVTFQKESNGPTETDQR